MSYPISDYAKSLFTAPVNYPQTIDITVSGLQETFYITEKDIEINGLSIVRRSISGNKIQIGSAMASTLTLRLKNTDGKFNNKVFEGAEMFLNLGIYKTDAKQWEQATKQFIPLGYFTVDSRPKKLNTISLTAYDRMAKFDKEYDSTFTFPVTLKTVLLDACSKCAVPISEGVDIDSLPNINATISELPESGLDTYRTALIWIGELTASVAYIDWEGKLQIGWYSETALPDKITKANRYTSSLEENDITISGVKIKTDDDTEYVSGTSDYQVEIISNGFAQNNLQDIVDNIGAVVNGTTYRPFSATCRPNCWAYPLDRMVFVDNAGVETQGLVTYHKFALNGRTEIKSEGETAQSSGYASAGNLTRHEQQIIKKAAKKAEKDLSTAEQALINFNKTIANSMGLYTTEVVLEDGSKKFYQHDKPTLAESLYIATETAGGFAYTNEGWNGGSPVWQYGVDRDGNAVFRTLLTHKIQTELLEAGCVTAEKISTLYKESVAEAIGAVGNRVTETESAIEQNATDITLRVSQAVYDLREGEVNEALANRYTKGQADAKLSLKIDKDDSGQIVSLIEAYADVINFLANKIRIQSDYFELTHDGKITAMGGKVGGWNIDSDRLSARDTTDTPTPTIIVQVGIQEDIIDGGWYYEAKTGYDRYTYVFDLTLYRNYTITHTGVADKAILTNEFPPTDVPPTRTLIYSFVDHNLNNSIPDTNKWCYLVIDTDDPAFTVSITAAAPSEDTSGMLSSDTAKGHAQIVMGVEASMPSPMFVGQSNIRHFAGKPPGETPDSNVDVPFYTTETGLTKVGDLIVEGGIYSESADGKYVFIKDGKVVFGDKNTRNMFEISLAGLLQKYFYGSTEMPGFKVDLKYGYPTSYADINNANIT